MLINQAKQPGRCRSSVLADIQNIVQIQRCCRPSSSPTTSRPIDQQFTRASGRRSPARPTSRFSSAQRALAAIALSLRAFAWTVRAGVGRPCRRPRPRPRQLVTSSQAAVGVLQATQAGNQLLAVQARQLADLTAMLVAAQGRADALEQPVQAAAEGSGTGAFPAFPQHRPATSPSPSMFH